VTRPNTGHYSVSRSNDHSARVLNLNSFSEFLPLFKNFIDMMAVISKIDFTAINNSICNLTNKAEMTNNSIEVFSPPNDSVFHPHRLQTLTLFKVILL